MKMSVLLLLATALAIGACGRRAERLDPPEGSDPAAYPRTYPTY
ncbi:MAG: hypothetical protein RLO50_21700 [Azospirillaceae bacterium]